MTSERWKIFSAPMEGVTGYSFRQAHRASFAGVDVYCTPFISVGEEARWRKRDYEDVRPEHNEVSSTLPQILTGSPRGFIAVAAQLAEMGYREVNLNLGCPSATVVTKGKGAGMLADPDELERFLDEVFAQTTAQGIDLRISVKTRLGISDAEEFRRLSAVYRKFPLSWLMIHGRTRRQQYGGHADWEACREAIAESACPVCWNGDICAPENMERLEAAFPQKDYPALQAVMIGRGLMRNPALARQLRGGKAADAVEFSVYHEKLLQAYRIQMQEENNVLFRMKEFWSYAGPSFPGWDRMGKKIRKARRLEDYCAAVRTLLTEG